MILIMLLVSLWFSGLAHALPAFPTAEGYGADTVHGRGGHICPVTTTTDSSNAGSLRYCLEVDTGPRIVIFRVGGIFRLNSSIEITDGNLYIAGHTAPGDGVLIRDQGVAVVGTTDVIVRHVRFVLGVEGFPYDPEKWCPADGFCVNNFSSNVVVDHSTMMWGTDQSANVASWSKNVTFQWCLFGEGVRDADFNPDNEAEHSKGLFISGPVNTTSGPVTVSLHHSAFAHTVDRNPLIGDISPPSNVIPPMRIDMRNTIVYSWVDSGGQVEITGSPDPDNPIQVNLVNNIWKPHPNQSGTGRGNFFLLDFGPSSVYLSGNWGTSSPVRCPTGCTTSEWDVFWNSHSSNNPWDHNSTYEADHAVYTPFTVPAVTTTPTSQVMATVLANVGVMVPARSTLEARIVDEIENGTGTVGPGDDGFTYTYPTINSGTPYTDSDGDGMSNTWETNCSGTLGAMNPSVGTDGDDTITGVHASVNNYTKVEVFLNAMAGDYGPDGLTTCAGLLIEDETGPSTPNMNTASVVSDTRIDLSWSAATDAQSGISGYELQWCTDDGSETCTPSTTISLGDVTSYSHTTLTAETTYGYRVRALNGASTPLPGNYSSPVEYATTESDEVDITTGLVSHWTFDDVLTDSGSAVASTSSVGSPGYVSGVIGNAVDLNGTSQYVTVADNASHDFGTSTHFSVAFWVKPDAGAFQYLVSKSQSAGAPADGSWGVEYGGISGSLLAFVSSDTWNDSCAITSAVTLADTEWHHIAVNVYRGASCTTSDIEIYTDGVLDTSSTVISSSNNTNVNITNNDPLWIGANNDNGTAGAYVNGAIDDVRIYNRTLSAADVTALFTLETDTVTFAGAPSSLSDSASGTATFAGAPSSLSDSASGTATFAGTPTSLSDSASGTATFAGAPTGVSSP